MAKRWWFGREPRDNDDVAKIEGEMRRANGPGTGRPVIHAVQPCPCDWCEGGYLDSVAYGGSDPRVYPPD